MKSQGCGFETIGVVLPGEEVTTRVVSAFIKGLCGWVEVTPLPDGEYLMETKDEPAYRGFLEHLVDNSEGIYWWKGGN